MANMGYCRFQNTFEDMLDCEEHMQDRDLSEDEKRARANLLRLCERIASDYAREGEQE